MGGVVERKVLPMKNLAKVMAMTISVVAMTLVAQDTEIVKVKGRGVGADKAEALKDAYRDAVERAVGFYIDAEQLMKNEELVKNQILTQSNAYIEKCEVTKEAQKSNGFVEVQILAVVRKTALAKKIADVMPTKKYALGGELKNVHAKMTTSEKRNLDGAALLKNALEGFDPFLMVTDCVLASPKSVLRERRHPREPKNSVAVNYLFKAEINQRRFVESVVPRLKDILAQISLAEPKEITIPLEIGDAVDVEQMIERGQRSPNRLEYEHAGLSAKSPDYDYVFQNVQNKDTGRIVVLVVGGNKFKTSYQGVVYELDAASAKVVSDWGQRMSRTVDFNVSLLDGSGEAIFNRKISPWDRRRVGYGCVSVCLVNGRITTIVAPWIETGRGLEFDYYTWHEFVLPKDSLPEIKELKIEIAK